MKVLFVGEGPHDVGRESRNSLEEPCPAGGVVTTLARRVVSSIGADSLALRWSELVRFHPSAKKGFAGKVAAAALLSRRYECVGTICVADRDRKPDREQAMQDGQQRALAISSTHPVVCGIAVESIEAWTLGAHGALADELGIDAKHVRAELLTDVESLYENSGKPKYQPKAVLQGLAQKVHRDDCVNLRVAVAERTNLAELERACPAGFAPFAKALREAFAG